MKEYEIRGGNLQLKHIRKIYFLGWVSYLFYIHMCIAPYLFVCGDDRIIYYPGADDLTSEPGDA